MRGVVFCLAGASCFGTLGLFSKLAYQHGGDPYTMTFMRFAIAGPILLLLAQTSGAPRPGRASVMWALLLGVGQFGAAFALLAAYAHASIALVLLAFYVYPVVVVGGSALLYREELGLQRLIIITIALTGIALAVGSPHVFSGAALLLGLCAAVCVAAVILGSRHLMISRGLSPRWLVALTSIGPAFALAFAVPLQQPQLDLGPQAWGWTLCVALISTVLAATFFYTGVKLIGSGTAALLATTELVVGLTLGFAVLHDSPSSLQLIGSGLVIAAVARLSLGQRSRRADA